MINSWWPEGILTVSADKTTARCVVGAATEVQLGFTPVLYSIAFSVPIGHGTLRAEYLSGGGNIPNGSYVPYGTIIRLIATPDSGYKVRAWAVNSGIQLISTTTQIVEIKDHLSAAVEFTPL